MKWGTRLFVSLPSIITLIAVFSLPLPTEAACCKCAPKDKPGTTICLTDTTANCPEILTKNSSNAALLTLTCEPTSLKEDSTCKPVAEGGSALCQEGPTPASAYGSAGSTTTTTTGAQKTRSPIKAVPMTLNVPIPGLQFAQNIYESAGYLEIPYLAQYLSAIYNYLLGIVIIAAAVMIVIGGFKYILSSTFKGIQDGKEMIKDAVIGLVLVLSTVTLLQTINPGLVNYQALRIKVIEPEEITLFKQFGTMSGGPSATGGGGNFKPIDGICPEPANPKSRGAYSRIMETCKGTAGTRDDLIRVVKKFKEEGLDNQGAMYIRGGVGGGSSIAISGAQGDFMISSLKSNNLLNDEIRTTCGGDSATAKNLNTPACMSLLLQNYGSYAGGTAACNDVLGTDCGYFVSQALRCANVAGFNPSYPAAAYTFRNQVHSYFGGQEAAELDTGSALVALNGKIQIWKAIDKKDPVFKSVASKFYFVAQGIVPRSLCAANPGKCKLAQEYDGGKANPPDIPGLAASGKIRFGAIMMMCGSEKDRCNHFFLYVGGADLPYETIETGSGANGVGTASTVVFKKAIPTAEGSSDRKDDAWSFGIKITPTLKQYMDKLDPKSLIYYANTL